jgi:ubiquinone/menaquinone biosynthesis C-methylase UbiE
MDATAAKAKEHKSWSAASPAWKKYDPELLAWVAPVTDRMLERLRLAQGQRILDLASGTGEPSLAIAERVGPLGSVLGSDFVEAMLVVAREKAANRGLHNVEYRVADGETLEVPAGSFDGASMRFGLMFMPDPVAAMKRVHHALKPGGRAVIVTWGAAAKNPWAGIPVAALKRQMEIPAPEPGAPGLFAFADPERLRSTLTQAGFAEVEIDEVANEVGSFADGAAYGEFIFTLSGPLAVLLGQLPADKQAQVKADVAAEIEQQFRRGPRLAIPGSAWLAVATR